MDNDDNTRTRKRRRLPLTRNVITGLEILAAQYEAGMPADFHGYDEPISDEDARRWADVDRAVRWIDSL